MDKTSSYTRTVSSASLAYQEKLKDPRWQRKRSEILRANHFRCEDCKRTEKTLEIHHCYYIKGFEPWEYGVELLMCLCSDCHEHRQKREQFILCNVAKSLRCFTAEELETGTCDIVEYMILKRNEKYAQSFTA